MLAVRPWQVLFVLAAWPVAAIAEEAEDAFNSLYGNEYKKVMATRDLTDDVALASALLAAAKAPGTHPALAALLCEKSYELGVKAPAGSETAVEAMELLAERTPDRKAACFDRIVGVRQRQYDAAKPADRADAGDALIGALVDAADAWHEARNDADAAAALRRASLVASAVGSRRKDEVQARSERQAARLRAEKLVAELQKRLDANPQDAGARKELVQQCLVELDDPARAEAFLDESVDPAMRKYVPAAAKGVEAAPEAACLELAEWYRGLADSTASPGGKLALLARAWKYYTRFLSLHAAQDVARSQAALALKKVEDAMAKLGPPPSDAPGPWIDLLKLVDPAKHAVAGKWQRNRDGTLQVSGQEAGMRAFVPCMVEGGYEMTVTFARPKSDLDVVVIIPVSATGVALKLSMGVGAQHILQNVAPGVPGVRPGKLDNSQDHTVDVKVLPRGDQAEVVIHLDGKPLFHWQGAQAGLSVAGAYQLPHAKCPALGSHCTTVVFKTFRLRTLGGKVKPLQ